MISPWALYFTGWYDATLHSTVAARADARAPGRGRVRCSSPRSWAWTRCPGRVSHPFRLLLLILTLPFHAFLGVTIMGQTELIGGDWYPDRCTPRCRGCPDPLDDQHLAGGILWGSGDLIAVLLFAVLFAQWVRASMAEARARGPPARPARRAAAKPSAGDPTTSEDTPVNR